MEKLKLRVPKFLPALSILNACKCCEDMENGAEVAESLSLDRTNWAVESLLLANVVYFGDLYFNGEWMRWEAASPTMRALGVQ